MQWLLTCLSVVLSSTGSGHAVENAPSAILPAIVYRDHLFLHYRDRIHKVNAYVIEMQSLNIPGGVTFFGIQSDSRHNLESVFVRGNVLVVAGNCYSTGRIAGNQSIDEVHYLSADRACDAKWIYVEPTGEPLKFPPEVYSSIMWRRKTPTQDEQKPGDTELWHTAVAAEGPRNLLVFDLYVTAPMEGAPTPKPRMKMMRIVPEERARTGFFANVGKPEKKGLGEMPAAFSEAFQAYFIGDDYYFITKSGSVYRSAPPEKDKPRTMSALWTSPKPRVAYIISDGERLGVHFLITARDKTGWHYFRLGPDPKLELLSKDGPVGDDLSPSAIVRQLADQLRAKKLIGEAR